MAASNRQTVEERTFHGESLRKEAPLSGHGEWTPARGRPDPVELLEEQNKDRLDFLVPVRRWRMN